MNSKGQANSVFKILIAAVVAGAILMILMNVLKPIPIPGDGNPNDSATNLVMSNINSSGIPSFTEATFNTDDSLNSKTIALKSKVIDKDRVCVLVSEKAPNYDGFSSNNSLMVQYTGSYNIKTRLMVMCDKGDELAESMDVYEYSSDYGFDVTTDCDGIETPNKYCVVVVVGE